MVIAFSVMPRSSSCAKKLPPPSREYLPASSVTPKAPIAPAEPAKKSAQSALANAATRMRTPSFRIGVRVDLLDPRAGKMRGVRLRLRAPHVAPLPVLGIVLAAGLLAVEYSSQATQWAVMTDELQTSKLATSIGETLSPVPRIHGAYYGSLNQLYPLLLSPLYGWLSAPTAFDAAHVVNAFLLASWAWPTYLLGRAVTGRAAGGYFAAAVTAFTPWLVLSSTLLTENAAYPAFVWAVFLCYRAVVEPSAGRDAAAVAALALAYLARTQLFVLAFALPIAVLAHERDLRRALARHRLLAVAYGAGAVAAVGLAAAGELTRVLGNYAGTVQGDVLPAGIWHAAAVHLDEVVVGTGVAPFLLAAAWAFTPSRREAQAFSALFVPLVVLITFEAASFDLRFTPGAFTQDRYVCYLAPLLAVGAAACLLDPGRRAVRAGLVLAAALAFAGLAAAEPFDEEITLWWASPAATGSTRLCPPGRPCRSCRARNSPASTGGTPSSGTRASTAR